MGAVVFEPQPVMRRADLAARWLLAAVYVASFLLNVHLLNGAPVLCPFRIATGLPCPGCGMTHAFVCLSHGHFREAVHYNALGPLVYAFGLVWLSGQAFGWPRVRFSPAAARWLPWVALSITLIYGVLRIAIPALRPF